MPLEELLQLPFPDMFYQLILPFLFIFTLLYASLRTAKVFNNVITFVLSIIFTALIVNSPLFPWLGSMLLYFGASIAVGAFVVLFVVGVIFLGLKKERQWQDEFRQLKRLENRRAKLLLKVGKTKNSRKVLSLRRQIDAIEDDIEVVTARAYRRRNLRE